MTPRVRCKRRGLITIEGSSPSMGGSCASQEDVSAETASRSSAWWPMGSARKWVGRGLGFFGCFGGRDRWLPREDGKSGLVGCDRRFEPEDITAEGGDCARLCASVWASVSKGLVAMYGIRTDLRFGQERENKLKGFTRAKDRQIGKTELKPNRIHRIMLKTRRLVQLYINY